MPKELEAKLKAEAERRWPGDEEHQDRYVYGTLAKLKKESKAHAERKRNSRH